MAKKILESELITKVKKHYGTFRLDWVRQNPVWKPRIPDYLVAAKRSTLPHPLMVPKAGIIEFKCESNFLSEYTTHNGTKPKLRSDNREQQLVFVKNLLSNSCIINYNSSVQQIEEYVWVYEDSEGNKATLATPKENLTPRLVLLSCCTLKDIKINSIEDMLYGY